ncbi:hypothetical protein D3C57_129560 [Streptomyces rapamycinicus NRRL 5491]|uniref:Integrase n=1 Tax=Streptomyces rapamycinicus (strain ATCC 29253 / DSM 41530 / NRRL 5491 / AYB-994) TaxID=1343740 RepID=A0A3L8R1M6_STRRN|nr:hypothetical protein D3C57_129560 [Streptomyces rapamycinicus NRRL 5491]
MVGRRRRRARVHVPVLEIADPAATTLGPLKIEVTFPDNRAAVVDWTREPQQRLLRALAAELAASCAVGQGTGSPYTLRNRARSCREWARWIASTEDVDLRVSDLLPSHLDRFEDHLRERHPESSRTPYARIADIVWILRRLSDTHGGFSPALVRRLAYISAGPVGSYTPRDAYSPHVVEQLKAAARSDVDRAIRRLTVEGPSLLSRGQDPRVAGWASDANVVWEIHQKRGQFTRQELADQVGQTVADEHSPGRLAPLLYPTTRDLFALLLLFCLESGMEVEAARELTAGCLKNPNRGYVQVEYLKRRRHGQEWNTIRVRDGSSHSPGGLLRLALRLTASVREITGSPALWQFRTKEGSLTTGLSASAVTYLAKAFVYRHGISDAGQPVELRMSRLRKTYKAAVYKVTGGRMSAFVQGHSPDIAAAHYADIPSLRDLHEQAVADGLHDALNEARSPSVLTPEAEERLLQRPAEAPELLGVSPTEAGSLLSGESDLWLSSCRDFFDSPFGVKGKACPVSFFGCLGCGNAVITRRKLPAILAFLNHIEGERAKMPEAEWAERFGGARQQILRLVLPKFSESDVLSAQAVAESADPLLFLPSILFGGH